MESLIKNYFYIKTNNFSPELNSTDTFSQISNQLPFLAKNNITRFEKPIRKNLSSENFEINTENNAINNKEIYKNKENIESFKDFNTVFKAIKAIQKEVIKLQEQITKLGESDFDKMTKTMLQNKINLLEKRKENYISQLEKKAKNSNQEDTINKGFLSEVAPNQKEFVKKIEEFVKNEAKNQVVAFLGSDKKYHILVHGNQKNSENGQGKQHYYNIPNNSGQSSLVPAGLIGQQMLINFINKNQNLNIKPTNECVVHSCHSGGDEKGIKEQQKELKENFNTIKSGEKTNKELILEVYKIEGKTFTVVKENKS